MNNKNETPTNTGNLANQISQLIQNFEKEQWLRLTGNVIRRDSGYIGFSEIMLHQGFDLEYDSRLRKAIADGSKGKFLTNDIISLLTEVDYLRVYKYQQDSRMNQNHETCEENGRG